MVITSPNHEGSFIAVQMIHIHKSAAKIDTVSTKYGGERSSAPLSPSRLEPMCSRDTVCKQIEQ